MQAPVSFGAWLKQRRKALDLTCAELSQQVGCAVVTIRKLEIDARRPSRQMAERLAAHLQLPPDERDAFVAAARAAQPTAPAPAAPALPLPPLAGRAVAPPEWPAPLTPLIGRAHEVAAVTLLMQRPDVRLVTLTGVGGVGKTRLAFQVAADLQSDFADGVAVVELAPLRAPDLVAPTIAQTLGLKDVGGQGIVERLKVYLRARHVLLVLDNFEHLLPAAPLVVDLLHAAPRLTVLGTSRAVLHLSGEYEFPVPPLKLPDPGLPLDALAENEAVRLFVARAQAVKADFQLTAANAAEAAALCRHLEGLPLAIELAAARSKLLPPRALLDRFTQQAPNRLTLLTGGPRDLAARQQTIRATIAWSYDLLDAAEQQLFARLGVFAGGFSLEAVEAVCHTEGGLDLDPLDGVAALVDNSLLRPIEGSAGAPRFGMLETLLEYAREKLDRSGEAAVVRQRHAAYCLNYAEVVAPRYVEGGEQIERLRRIAAERDNLWSALAWARDRGDAMVGLRLATTLWWFWNMRGYYREGRQWLETFLQFSERREDPAPQMQDLRPLRAQALFAAGELARQDNDHATAAIYLEESVALWRALGDKRGLGHALRSLALATGRRHLLEEALALYEQVGDRGGIAHSLLNLGRNAEDPVWATAALERALALFRDVDETTGVAWALTGLGEIAVRQGNYVQALAPLKESLDLFRALEDRQRLHWVLATLARAALGHGTAAEAALFEQYLSLARELCREALAVHVLHRFANAARDQGDYARANPLYVEGLSLARQAGDRVAVSGLLRSWGESALLAGDTEAASRRGEESLILLREAGDRIGTGFVLDNLGYVAQQRGDLAGMAVHFAQSLQLARETGVPSAIKAALAGLAGLAARQGHALAAQQGEEYARAYGRRAARLFGAAAAIPDPFFHAHRVLAERNVAVARALVDEAMWEAAWAEGRAMPLEQAVAYALERGDAESGVDYLRDTT